MTSDEKAVHIAFYPSDWLAGTRGLTPADIPDTRPARPTGHGIKPRIPERYRSQ